MKKSLDHSLTILFVINIIMGLILFFSGISTLHTARHLPQPPQVSVKTVSTAVHGVDVDQNRVTATLNVGFLFENKGATVDRVTVSASQLTTNHKNHLNIAKSESPVKIIRDAGAGVGDRDEYEEDDCYDTKWFALENVTAEVADWDVVGDVFYDVADGEGSAGMRYGEESGVFYVDFALTCDVSYESGGVFVPWGKRRTVGMEVGCEDLKVEFSSNGTRTMDGDGDGGAGDGGLVFRSCGSNGEELLEKVGHWLFVQGMFLLSLSFLLLYSSIVILFFKFFVFSNFVKTNFIPF